MASFSSFSLVSLPLKQPQFWKGNAFFCESLKNTKNNFSGGSVWFFDGDLIFFPRDQKNHHQSWCVESFYSTTETTHHSLASRPPWIGSRSSSGCGGYVFSTQLVLQMRVQRRRHLDHEEVLVGAQQGHHPPRRPSRPILYATPSRSLVQLQLHFSQHLVGLERFFFEVGRGEKNIISIFSGWILFLPFLRKVFATRQYFSHFVLSGWLCASRKRIIQICGLRIPAMRAVQMRIR